MELDNTEASQDIASSTEPRPKPFDDTDRPLKKRQRIHSGPIDLTANLEDHTSSDTTHDTSTESEMELTAPEPLTPPTQAPDAALTPMSSKVTLNLRSTLTYGDNGSKISEPPIMDDTSDIDKAELRAATTEKLADTQSPLNTTSARSESLPIELVIEDDQTDNDNEISPVAIIDVDSMHTNTDLVVDFPNFSGSESSPIENIRVAISDFEIGMSPSLSATTSLLTSH